MDSTCGHMQRGRQPPPHPVPLAPEDRTSSAPCVHTVQGILIIRITAHPGSHAVMLCGLAHGFCDKRGEMFRSEPLVGEPCRERRPGGPREGSCSASALRRH